MNGIARNIVANRLSKTHIYLSRKVEDGLDDAVIDKDSNNLLSDGNLQQLQQILVEKNITFEEFVAQRKLTTTTTAVLTSTNTFAPLIPDDGGSTTDAVSLGLILPIVLVGVFLVCVAACLYWHSWRDKRRLQGEATVPNLSLSTVSRTNQNADDWKVDLRCSTRSTTPLRSGYRDASTHQNMAYNNSFSDSMSTSRSSYSTNTGTSFNREDQERHMHGRRQLSPIDEISPHVSKLMGTNVSSASQYEGYLPSHGNCSPYHLTWVSPQKTQVSRRPEDLNNNRAIVETSFYRSAKSSPFFPNNNTPTTEFEETHRGISPAGIINPSISAKPMCYNNVVAERYTSSDISSDTSYTDASAGTAIGAVSSLDYPGAPSVYSNRKCPSEDGSRDASDSSSLPSSINPFSLRNAARFPEHRHSVPTGMHSGMFAQTTISEPLASSIDSYTSSENTSLYPNVGSSVNTTSQPFSLPMNPVSLPHASSTTPNSASGGDYVFDTAINLVGGEVKTCLVSGDTSSMASSNIATALFRSWSASAELNFTNGLPAHPVGSPMSAPPGVNPFHSRTVRDATHTAVHPDTRIVVGGSSHNNLDKSQVNNRHTVFQNIPPVLDDRKYWL